MMSEERIHGESPPPGEALQGNEPLPSLGAEEPPPPEGNVSHQSFPIVALGASAGGLDAYQKFFDRMPSDSGMAFVIISHLDPSRQSMLTQLLGRHTAMEVREAQDKTLVEPNKVYVIPPDKYLRIEKRVLRLSDPDEPRGTRMAIDYFFRSLAEDQGENAIGIILSGNGSDGTLGVRALNALGGIVLVQDPVTAQYDGMPISAVATGLADFVLPVEQMPEHVMGFIRQYFPRQTRMFQEKAGPHPSPLSRIFGLLRARTGHDFSQYKRSTIQRRIERRISIHKLESPADYVKFLEDQVGETKILFRELLIGVTGFFRDPEAFEILKRDYLPRLLENRREQSALRIWVPGCATGEEAYSLAMVFQEYMEEAGRGFRYQIFGTDIDNKSIDQARTALFPLNAALDIPPERLDRFFIKNDRGYQIKKEVRENVVFAVHNVIKDAPFTKLDVLSCRNLLIYFQSDLQNRLLPFFHYSLRPGGILFLGSSESVGKYIELFQVLDKRWKIYERRDTRPVHHMLTFASPAWPTLPANDRKDPAPSQSPEPDILHLTRKMLLNGFTPPCVTINRAGEILYVQGQAGKYLELAQGRISTSLSAMARDELKGEIRSVLNQLDSGATSYLSPPVSVRTNEGTRLVRIVVRPVANQDLIWVIFQELADSPAGAETRPDAATPSQVEPSSQRIAELEMELQRAKENLQAALEDHQAANEELRSANEELQSTNEELQSTNEELQSTNEELETSKEELQSLNEELITVNSELVAKVEQLTKMQSDMKNLLENLRVGVIFLDSELRVKRFTAEATKLVRLIPSDIGRPLSHLSSSLNREDLISHARQVLETLVPKEMEAQTCEGDWYLLRIMPYRTLDNVIDGLVLTLDNISQTKKADAELARLEEGARKFAESIIETIREPFLILDEDLRVHSANALFYSTFQVAPDQTVGNSIYHLGRGQWNIPALRGMIENVISEKRNFKDFRVGDDFPHIGRRQMLLNARLIFHEGMNKNMILLAMQDVTEEKA